MTVVSFVRREKNALRIQLFYELAVGMRVYACRCLGIYFFVLFLYV